MHISKTNNISWSIATATQSTAKAYFNVMHKSIKARFTLKMQSFTSVAGTENGGPKTEDRKMQDLNNEETHLTGWPHPKFRMHYGLLAGCDFKMYQLLVFGC